MLRIFSYALAARFSLRFASLVVCGLFLSGCSGRVDLLASIPEADANEVIAALINEGIEANKVSGKEGMVGIQVGKNQSAKAVDVLRSKGLPREQFVGMGQVFRKDGLISSPIEERARYLYALSQDLSATLSHIDGVLFARVHLVLPERGSGSDRDTPSSAAVFIKHQTGADIEILQPQVRRLVVNSIPGLTLDRVSVILIPSAANLNNAKQSWEVVMGLQVHPSSVNSLMGVLWVLVAFSLVALGGTAYWVWRFLWLPRRNASQVVTSQSEV